jgi:ParB family chromosome partitioning protein
MTTKTAKPKKEDKPAMSKENAFSGAAESLGGSGIDALFAMGGPQYSMIPLDMIEVKVQIRETFEDEENTLEDLAASIKVRGVLQPIVLRPTDSGYELVAGERRYRATKLAGLDQIPAIIRELTDEEAEDAQLAENIHRKNLSQIEEAKKIQRDLDKLGSVEAVLAKHQKSRAWLSKVLSLLDLPEQAKRLVTENVSADVEVINAVKIVEKIDPVKAKELVEKLKETRGKASARDKVAAVKADVKPSKKQQEAKKGPEKQRSFDAKDRSQEALSAGDIFAGAKTETGSSLPGDAGSDIDVGQELDKAYVNIFEHGSNASLILETMGDVVEEAVSAWLANFYEAGKQAKDASRAVIQGFRSSQFATEGHRAFALVAFLQGADSGAKFHAANILASVKE